MYNWAGCWCQHKGGVAYAKADAKVVESHKVVKEKACGGLPPDFFKDIVDSLGAWTTDTISVTAIGYPDGDSLKIFIAGGPFNTRATDSLLNQQATLSIVVTDSDSDTLFGVGVTLSDTAANPCADLIVTGDLSEGDFYTTCVDSVTTVFLDTILKVSYDDTTFYLDCDFHAWTWHDSIPPDFVDLSSFTATGRDGRVEVQWETAAEVNNAGFNLHRSLSKEGPYATINDQLIPARGSTIEGAFYSFTDENVVNGTIYYYQLEDVDIHGRTTMHGPISATPGPSSVDEDQSPLPTSFSLAQNYPNPFNATTDIRYSLPVESDVTLTIYNLKGQRVKTLVAERQPAGHKVVSWNGLSGAGEGVTSGLYFYRLQAGDYTEVRRMVLLK